MNAINTTKRLIFGLALSGMLLVGTGTGFAEDKDNETRATISTTEIKNKLASYRVQQSGHEDYWCKALQAKGLCTPGSVLHKSCAWGDKTQNR